MAEKGDARLLLLIVPFLAAWPLGGAREAAGQDRSTDRGRAVVPLTGRQLTQPNLLMLPTAVSVCQHRMKLHTFTGCNCTAGEGLSLSASEPPCWAAGGPGARGRSAAGPPVRGVAACDSCSPGY